MMSATQRHVNSSLTLRPSAGCWANRRWWGSDGWRPQIEHGRLDTHLMCTLSRSRRGSGIARTLLSIDVERASGGVRGCLPAGELVCFEPAGDDLSFAAGGSTPSKSATFSRNAFSTAWASADISRFL